MKPHPMQKFLLTSFSYLATFSLLCASCAPIQTPVPTTKLVSTSVPATSTPPATLTPVPQIFGDTVTAPECVKGGQPDTKAFDELIESLMPSLYEMESFRYKTVYRYTTAEGYPEDELSVEVEGSLSGLLATPGDDWFYTFLTQIYGRSHTVLTDLRTRDRTEAIAIDDAFWIRAADSTTDWMAFTDPAEMQNLAETFSPQILLLIMGVGDSHAPLMAQTETLDGREVLHRCWIPQASDDDVNAYMTIFDDWYSFFSGAEVHLWTAQDDSQLVRIVITGKYIGDNQASEFVEPETPRDFLLWMDIFEVDLPIEIEAPSEIALTLSGSDLSETPTIGAPYNELPLPADAIAVGTFDEFEKNESGGTPREFTFSDLSFSYDALTTYTGEGWPSDPIDRQPTYQTEMGFTEAAVFYLREMNRRGWKLQEKYFQFGLQELYLFFTRDEIMMPVILGPGEQGGTHISAILPPSDDELEAILNGWVSYTHENSDLPEGVVSAIAFDNEDRAWIGTNNGLSVFDGTTWRTYSEKEMGFIPQRFHVFTITCLAVGSDGRMWVGTNSGLAVFDGTVWKTYTPENSNIPGKDIYALAVDQQGRIWLGADKYFIDDRAENISVFDGKTFTNYTRADIGLSDQVINTIALDQQDRMWIGTGKGGVYFFDGVAWKAEKSPTDYDYSVEDIAIDHQGQVWIGTWWKGLSMYNGENWKTFDPQNSNFPFEHISVIAIGANDEVWAGSTVGLAVFGNDGNSKTYTPLRVAEMGKNWYALAIDDQGRIWVGTDTGLYVFTPPKP